MPRLNTPVRSGAPFAAGAGQRRRDGHHDHGAERFDDVVLACHSDQSLALLADASGRRARGAGRHPLPPQPRRAAHRRRVLPAAPLAWAAWNYERAADRSRDRPPCACTT
jgi:predicted NAD/FAD-binding protein